ncbi:MAG: alpha/beta fold hydrolase [Anaerolineae bacterium]|nr:alpha/beta fold hydrolase [Anaerolineae bacterium]
MHTQILNRTLLHNPHVEGDPFFWEGGPVGILLAHGYTATPAEVRLLAQALHKQGYTVSGLLLPGHGCSPREMNRCRWPDWVGAMEEAYQTLADRCEQVFVGGESMGALLALHLAAQYTDITGVLTYSPAVRIAPHISVLTYLLWPFLPHVNKRLPALHENWQGYKVNPVPALNQLVRLQRVVTRQLPTIQQPLLIVQGRHDDQIDLRGTELLHQRIGSGYKEMHWMEKSSHVVLLDCEIETVTEITLRFIERVLTED